MLYSDDLRFPIKYAVLELKNNGDNTKDMVVTEDERLDALTRLRSKEN